MLVHNYSKAPHNILQLNYSFAWCACRSFCHDLYNQRLPITRSVCRLSLSSCEYIPLKVSTRMCSCSPRVCSTSTDVQVLHIDVQHSVQMYSYSILVQLQTDVQHSTPDRCTVLHTDVQRSVRIRQTQLYTDVHYYILYTDVHYSTRTCSIIRA